MGVTELVLLIFGGVVFTVSFLLPAGRKENAGRDSQADEELVREMVDREITAAKTHISDIVNETITYSMEKTERSMERLTNEKIMAVNEYSDTVLEQINKNHKEAVFLYDMLNDKHEKLKGTVGEAVKTEKAVKQMLRDAEITAKQAKEQADAVKTQAPAEKPKEAPEKEQESAGGGQEFTPIQPERVELLTAPEKPEAAKPKKRTARKTKSVQTESVNEAGQAEPGKTETKAGAAEGPETDSGDTRNSNEKILELHKAGKSNVAIAREFGLGVGEVKLVIDLFEGN